MRLRLVSAVEFSSAVVFLLVRQLFFDISAVVLCAAVVFCWFGSCLLLIRQFFYILEVKLSSVVVFLLVRQLFCATRHTQ